MLKKIFPLLACLAPLTTYAVEGENQAAVCLRADAQALRTATDAYLDFINQIGNKGTVSSPAAIIAPNCKKVLNGQLFAENREEFVNDLLSVYENQGAWQVQPVDIITAPSNNTVVLRLFIEAEKFGIYTAMVILRYDSNYLITEINEVLSRVKGSYDFEGNE